MTIISVGTGADMATIRPQAKSPFLLADFPLVKSSVFVDPASNVLIQSSLYSWVQVFQVCQFALLQSSEISCCIDPIILTINLQPEYLLQHPSRIAALPQAFSGGCPQMEKKTLKSKG